MRKIVLKLLIVSGFVLMGSGIMAQTNPPTPPQHGSEIDQPSGGGAPIGGGTLILLGLGALYAGKKVYNAKKKTLLD